MRFLPAKLTAARLVPFVKMVSSRVFRLKRTSKAAVLVDRRGTPQWFLFDVFAFLDILSKVDEALVDRLSTEEYHDPSMNPAGWLIDTIETRLPTNPEFVLSLKKAIAEAKKKGWIPFKKIEQKLGLA